VDVPLGAQLNNSISSDFDLDSEEEQEKDGFIILENKPVNITPNFYVPFTQTQELCKTLITHWLSTIWFPPSDLNENLKIQSSHPIYVPFYSFTVTTECVFHAEIGIPKQSGEMDYQEVHGSFGKVYEELMTCASFAVNRVLIMDLLRKPNSFSLSTGKMLPHDMPEYRPDLKVPEDILPIDCKVERAFEEIGGQEKIKKWDKKFCLKKIQQDNATENIRNYGCNTIKLRKSFFVVLLPIYSSGFSYNGNNYEVVISGNKGVVEGNRPFGSGIVGKVFTEAVKKVTNLVADSI